MAGLSFRLAAPGDAVRCFEIENAAYEGDEGATLAKIAQRIDLFAEGFLVLELMGEIVGFINSGCTYQVDLAKAEFKDLVGHDPAGPFVVVLSVAVHPAHQHKGYAGAMMDHFVMRMARMGKTSIHLMCKHGHIGLYSGFGFSYDKPSSSTHGGIEWHEMKMNL